MLGQTVPSMSSSNINGPMADMMSDTLIHSLVHTLMAATLGGQLFVQSLVSLWELINRNSSRAASHSSCSIQTRRPIITFRDMKFPRLAVVIWGELGGTRDLVKATPRTEHSRPKPLFNSSQRKGQRKASLKTWALSHAWNWLRLINGERRWSGSGFQTVMKKLHLPSLGLYLRGQEPGLEGQGLGLQGQGLAFKIKDLIFKAKDIIERSWGTSRSKTSNMRCDADIQHLRR